MPLTPIPTPLKASLSSPQAGPQLPPLSETWCKYVGTVAEFIPSSDPNSPPSTEISGSPTVSLISTGNPLPTPVTLTAADTNPAGPIDQLEKYEGMRVHVDVMTVSGPTEGNLSEANATSTSNGVFFGVIAGIPQPFREPGVQLPDPLPAGAPATVTRWDTNPEILRVNTAVQTGSASLMSPPAQPLPVLPGRWISTRASTPSLPILIQAPLPPAI